MKKFILSILVVLHAAMIICAGAYASESVIIEIASVNGRVATDTDENFIVDIPVSITNNPGYTYYQMDIDFDNTKLRPVGLISGHSGEEIFSNIEDSASRDDLSGVTIISSGMPGMNSDRTEDGVLFTLQFEIITTEPGEIPVSINIEEGLFGNSNGEWPDDTEYELIDGSVIILSEENAQGAISVNKGIRCYMSGENECRVVVTNDDEDITDCYLILAVYNGGTGVMKESHIVETTISNGTVSKRFQVDEYDEATDYIKVYLWATYLDPMCYAFDNR